MTNQLEEAARLLREERQKRIEAFSEALRALCDEHQCDLTASVTIAGQQIQSSILVVPRQWPSTQ